MFWDYTKEYQRIGNKLDKITELLEKLCEQNKEIMIKTSISEIIKEWEDLKSQMFGNERTELIKEANETSEKETKNIPIPPLSPPISVIHKNSLEKPITPRSASPKEDIMKELGQLLKEGIKPSDLKKKERKSQ